MAVVLGLLDGLPRAQRGPLREDTGGKGDELLRGAALEETDRGEIVAGLGQYC